MVAKLSDWVEVEWFKRVRPISSTEQDESVVSGIGTIAAARVTPRDSSTEPFIAVSMYGRWIGAHPSIKTAWSFGYAEGSVYRIISDLSAFIGHENPKTHKQCLRLLLRDTHPLVVCQHAASTTCGSPINANNYRIQTPGTLYGPQYA